MNEPTHTEAVKTDLPSPKPNRRKRLALRFAVLAAAVNCGPLPSYATAVPGRTRNVLQDMPTVLVRTRKEPYLPAGRVTVPASVRVVIRKIRPGMTRANLDRYFAPVISRHESEYGIVSGLKSGEDAPSRRTNPQEFYYRFAYAPPELVHRGSKTPYWAFGKWVYGQIRLLGAVAKVRVKWRYANNRDLDKYRKTKRFGRTVLEAPVYDGVAGGSPDDVIVQISKPYLHFEPGFSAYPE